MSFLPGMTGLPALIGATPLYGPNLAPNFSDWEKTNAGDTFVDNGNGTWTYTVVVSGQNRPGIQTVATVTNATSPSDLFRVRFVISAATISTNFIRYTIPFGGATTPNVASLPLSVETNTFAEPSSGTRKFQIVIEANPAVVGNTFTIDTNAATVEFRTVL